MKSSQANIKLGHNCIKALTKSIKSSCTKLAGPCLYKGDHPQLELSMTMRSIQRQIRTQGSLPAYVRLNRKLIQCTQRTEQTEHQSDDQPTLQTMKRLTWCTYEQGKSRDVIFRLETRSLDSEVTWRTLTEPTKTAARSCAHQLVDKG